MEMFSASPRIVGALVGDIIREPGARTKYGLFFRTLAEHYPLVDVYDASLRGVARMVNAVQVMSPNMRRWKERFYQNVPAFRTRSSQAAQFLQTMQGRADLVLQVGVLFDAAWDEGLLPNIIYTDYTMHLSAQKPEAGRAPMSPSQRKEWIRLERRAFERARHICTRSNWVRESIIEDYNIPPEQVTVIGGGVNFATLPDMVTRCSDEPPTALFIGKDFYRKGGDLLLRAFAKAREQVPDAQLLLLTADPISSELPLKGVQVFKPTWDRAIIAGLYRRADVFVLPSRLETWGDVLLEAMTYGLPCIGVKGEAMEEIIEEGTTGLTVPPGDIDALAAALVRLFSDRYLCLQWGRSGRERIVRKYTWQQVVGRLSSVISAVCASEQVPDALSVSYEYR